MPHERIRRVEPLVSALLKWSPVVGVYGLRQSGKTVLTKKITALLGGEFESFDHQLALSSSEDNPEAFLSRSKLLCIDEAQKAPWIFPAIKHIVGTRRK